MADFNLMCHGSLYVLTPMTAEARGWREDNLPEECQQWMGGVVVEPRYVEAIVAGIQGAGLTLEG